MEQLASLVVVAIVGALRTPPYRCKRPHLAQPHRIVKFYAQQLVVVDVKSFSRLVVFIVPLPTGRERAEVRVGGWNRWVQFLERGGMIWMQRSQRQASKAFAVCNAESTKQIPLPSNAFSRATSSRTQREPLHRFYSLEH